MDAAAPAGADRLAIAGREPHPLQQRIIECDTRHRIVRCGRRLGKSALGITETERYSLFPHGQRLGLEPPGSLIGWFAPDYDRLVPIWDELERDLRPIVEHSNRSDFIMRLINGSVIEGWHLDHNLDAGRSRKFDLAVVDEAGMIEGLKRWMQGTADATLIDRGGRYLILSTSNASPDFDELFDEAEAGKSEWAAFTGTTFDNPHLPRAELQKIIEKRGSMPEWLWLREYMGIPPDIAGGFFSRSLIMRLLEKARAPMLVGRFDFGKSGMEDLTALRMERGKSVEWHTDPGGQWRLWLVLWNGRPRQDDDYALGCDIGAGVGASNSTISVGGATLRRKIGEYAWPGIGPIDFARLAAAAGYWFGGVKGCALIQFDVTGGYGEAFSQELQRLGYPRVAQQQFVPGQETDRSEKKYGFRFNPTSKETLFTEYREGLAGEFVNPSEIALRECLTYRYDKVGRLVSTSTGDEMMDEIARVPHADRCCADALLWEALRRLPRRKAQDIEPEPTTVGWAIDEIKRKEGPARDEEAW